MKGSLNSDFWDACMVLKRFKMLILTKIILQNDAKIPIKNILLKMAGLGDLLGMKIIYEAYKKLPCW